VRALHIPNAITVARILLVAPTAWLLLEERYGAAFGLFLVAGLSDALDGQLAKRFGWQTPLGGLLDPLADKLLLVVSFLCLGWLGVLPAWLVALVILRDLVIVTGAAVYHFRIARLEAEPMLLSKANTVAQIVLVLLAVAHRAGVGFPAGIIDVGIWIVTASTISSGVAYVVVWSRRALSEGRAG
jgi:cardiolipin synthase